MPTIREVLKGGLGVFALGMSGPLQAAERLVRASGIVPNAQTGIDLQALKGSRPLAPRAFEPEPRFIDGFPFKLWFDGDDFVDNIPFHSQQNDFPGGQPPKPSEEIDLVVVGGGISGLATAYELREYNPVVFEIHDRFGGNAQGGTINGAEFSLGSAYFITPDNGLPLDTFYRDLGLHEVVRVDNDPSPVVINGKINDDIWTGMGVPKDEIPVYEAYRQLVIQMTQQYPDVPFSRQWEIELDKLSLRQHIEQEVGMPIPDALAAAIQAYCYSSFSAGWEEISATLGWNFLAAEEFGRWVLPGGNAWMADKLWERLYPLDRSDPDHAPHLRPSCRVVDVRPNGDDRWLVTWRDELGKAKSLVAREVVMACPKNIAREIIHNLEADEPERYYAMRLNRRSYLVANIVLDRPVTREFYDIFLLEDPSTFPMSEGEANKFWRYTDVLDGSFTAGPNANSLPERPNVLTLYWPLPYEAARFDLILGDPIENFALALTPKLRETLELVGVPESSVQEIRFTRWGHALPLSRVGFIADGSAALVQSAYRDSVHFVNQDNWALPAIENSLLDAFDVRDTVKARLG